MAPTERDAAFVAELTAAIRTADLPAAADIVGYLLTQARDNALRRFADQMAAHFTSLALRGQLTHQN